MAKNEIDEMTTYDQLNWKFGVVTRTIEKIKNGNFLIHETSGRWLIAEVDRATLDKLISGEMKLSQLNWG